MSVWALVPVKPFALAKSRLASLFSPPERADLSQRLLSRTLVVLAETPGLARTLVVSRDPAALALAHQAGALAWPEPDGALDLNGALRAARAAALAAGAQAVLALPADLPRLTPADVAALLPGGGEPAVVVAPDRHGRGTNGLFLRPPDLIDFAFGPDSCREHLARARGAGLRPSLCQRPNLALDLDTPEDWAFEREYTSA